MISHPVAVQDRLLAELVRGALRPGARLDVAATAARLGATRTDVRDAVQALALRRLVIPAVDGSATVACRDVADLAEHVRVLCRTAAVMAADPRVDLDEVRSLLELPGSDAELLLDVVGVLIDHCSRRVAAHIVRDHLVPLRMVLRPGALAAHGIRIDHAGLARVLDAVADAAAADDRDALVAALRCAEVSLATTLRNELVLAA